ncbi:MAG: hypothetical protein ACYCST_12075 [Acidimicrobiales bacterium]
MRDFVRSWIEGLADRPWRPPSVPVPEFSQQPFYEMREAKLPFNVYVSYTQDYQTGLVDLVIVTPSDSPMPDRSGDPPAGPSA